MKKNFKLSKIIKISLFSILSACTFVSLLNLKGITKIKASEYQEVVYLDYDDSQNKFIERDTTDYKVLSSNTKSLISGEKYVVNSDVTITSNVSILGDVYLIVLDGFTVNFNAGISDGTTGYLDTHLTLTVCGGLNGTGNVNISSTAREYSIGALNGNLIQNGCNVSVIASTDGSWGTGHAISGNVNLNKGTLNAIGASNDMCGGAGIGGSLTANGGTATIVAGAADVPFSAIGDAITVNDGNIEITGGATYYSNKGSNAGGTGDVVINGGYLKLVGGTGVDGGATAYNSESISITGGKLVAIGGEDTNALYGSPAITGTPKSILVGSLDDGSDATDWDEVSELNTYHYVQIEFANHEHNFVYSAIDNVIYAECVGEDCPNGYDDNPLTLTLTAPENLIYDGNNKNVTFASGEEDIWLEVFDLEVGIFPTYYLEDGVTLTLAGTLAAGLAPSSVGKYVAKYTVDTDKTATLAFEILPSDQPELELYVEDYTYGDDPFVPSLSDDVKDNATVTYYYKVKDSSDEYQEWTGDTIDAGTYSMYAKISKTNNYNSKDTDVKNFTVKQKEITISWSEIEFTYNGEDQFDKVKATYETIDGETHEINSIYVKNNKNLFRLTASISSDPFIDVGVYTANVFAKDARNEIGPNYALPKNCKHTYEIGKGTNVISDFEMDDFVYGDTPSTPSATSKFGDVVFTYLDDFSGEYVGNIPTNANIYTIKAEVAGTDNYDAVSTTLEFEILKKDITITIDDQESVYKEDIVTLTASCDDLVGLDKISDICTLETDATNTSNVGDSYLIYPIDSNGLVSRNYNVSYSGSVEGIYGKYTITPILVEEPELDNNHYIYSGTELTYHIDSSSLYTVEGNKQTNPGIYNVLISLNDKQNYLWKNLESVEDLVYDFVIFKDKIDKPVDENGDEIENPVFVIIDSENGIDPNTVLVVKVLKLDKVEDTQNSETALAENNSVQKNEKIFGIYDAKLLLNNITEVQPDGEITIKILVPEEIRGKEFRLYHIHTNKETGEVTVFEIDYTDMDSEGYITFVTDRLSQFAFVGKDDHCIMHWFLIGLLVLGLALFALFYLVIKEKIYIYIESIVGILTTIILAIFGKCVVCTIFTIINILVFLAMGLFIFFTNKSKKDEELEEENVKEETVVEEPKVEEVSLKDSLATVMTVGIKGIVTKKSIAEYLKNTYGDGVELNCRPNYTNPGKGKSEGLPLADTHYTFVNNNKVCFVYVYETKGSILCLIKAPTDYANYLKEEHNLVNLSAFPKSVRTWYSVPIDDSFDEKQVYKMLDDVKKLNEGVDFNYRNNNKEITLKESLAVAKALGAVGTVTKKSIAKYLSDTFNEEVELNCRANQTNPGRGKTEGLPLADTHYTLTNNKRKCFVYVYENNGAILCLIKAPTDYANHLKEKHNLVNLSAFPKAKETWYSVAIDDSFTDVEVYNMLSDVKKINDANANTITFVKEVTVEEADKMISDEQTESLVESSQRKSNKAKRTFINLDTISDFFSDGETVTIDELKKRIPSFDKKATFYKVCARGKLDKKLTIDADDYSLQAIKMILVTGGKVLRSK